MANDAIYPGSNQFVIGVESGIDSPLTSETSGSGPREQACQNEKQQRNSETPGRQRPGPKVSLPQQRVAHDLERDSPASIRVQLLWRFRVALDEKERRAPHHPSC